MLLDSGFEEHELIMPGSDMLDHLKKNGFDTAPFWLKNKKQFPSS